ncbi:MAG: sensor histidine kinase [Bacteroidota bacterium]
MIHQGIVLGVAFAYVALLFAVAYWGDRRAQQGRSVIGSPVVYALSLGVYCTAWTFYGSVGRAATTGVGFLPTYLGPTLMALLWWVLLRKILRVAKLYRITSIADFVSARYGKSALLAGVVSVIAVVGIIPYISLQLKAISTSLQVSSGAAGLGAAAEPEPLFLGQTFIVALVLALFTILFGARRLDPTERHEGLVAAIAFESVVKLVAFVAVGAFVTFGVFDGFGDLFGQAAARADLRPLLTFEGVGDYGSWFALTFVSFLAILLLPRQFHVAVVENVDERHVGRAVWLFPLYLLAINVFVLPIALGGRLYLPAGVDADTFVLTLPLAAGQEALALLAFVGGLSAATGMVIVAATALSIMISNDLVMPVLLRLRRLRLTERGDLSALLLAVRRGAIFGILVASYFYFRLIGSAYSLVSIGLISFVAVAQFAPAFLGGLYWKRATRAGALAALVGGFAVWGYTLPLPSLVEAGLLPASFAEAGPLGIALLRPYALFGLVGLDPITHSLVWSALVNAGLFVGVSLWTRQGVVEHGQAVAFVDVLRRSGESVQLWRGRAAVADLRAVLGRFLGAARADEALVAYARRSGEALPDVADAALVQHAEQLLAGAIGAASARVVLATAVQEEPLSLREVMAILDETQQVIAYSRALEEKSRALGEKSAELEAATAELRAANERLTEFDRLKDEFVSTVTHELRTPLTSVRAFAEILHDNADLSPEQRREFLGIVIKESERLTRLVNQVLDLQKLDSGALDWRYEAVDLAALVAEAAAALGQVLRERGIALTLALDDGAPPLNADRDRLMQVLVNLLSNASKFCRGRIAVRLRTEAPEGDGATPVLRVEVSDDGPGIAPAHREQVFERFRQVEPASDGQPGGTGLGLAIARRIAEHHGGRLWVADGAPPSGSPGGSPEPLSGATFVVTLPVAPAPSAAPTR